MKMVMFELLRDKKIIGTLVIKKNTIHCHTKKSKRIENDVGAYVQGSNSGGIKVSFDDIVRRDSR